GTGVVKAQTVPPPIPQAKATPPPIPRDDRPRSMVRIDTEPDRPVRSGLVGRTAALTTLREAVGRALDFPAPRLITVVGNQGTGKTRLINELIGELRDKNLRVFHGSAEKTVKFSAIASLLRGRFELTPIPDEMSKIRFSHEIKEALGETQVSELLYLIGG